MAKCDICSAATSWEEGTVYTATEFQGLVSKGFEPPEESAFFKMMARRGKSRQEIMALFRQQAAQSSTDWLFCSSCANKAAQYMPR